MRRPYCAFSYGPGPRDTCYWATTIAPFVPPAPGDLTGAEVAIVGAGFTGLNAALTLAQAGADMIVFEAGPFPGWGASGRNGGFCCLGGSAADDTFLTRQFGRGEADRYRNLERAAVHLVSDRLESLGIDADRHSTGETALAHSPKAWARLQTQSKPGDILIPAAQLSRHGMAGPFHGARTTRAGFALNPAKYLTGLAQAASAAGARMVCGMPVSGIAPSRGGYDLNAGSATLRCKTVVLATNGYSSDDVPGWLASRYLPVQSHVLVTRPLSPDDLTAQGWTTPQMAYDTRSLLHYFRLMPNGRFLFGRRGGIRAGPRAQRRAARALKRDFHKMFPAWRHVDIPFCWSGFAALSADLTPFCGPVPDHPGMFAALNYHGNGVAMASAAGTILGHQILKEMPDLPVPAFLGKPPPKFPLGCYRSALLGPTYAALGVMDRL